LGGSGIDPAFDGKNSIEPRPREKREKITMGNPFRIEWVSKTGFIQWCLGRVCLDGSDEHGEALAEYRESSVRTEGFETFDAALTAAKRKLGDALYGVDVVSYVQEGRGWNEVAYWHISDVEDMPDQTSPDG
jgi:hypothetical protein